MVKFDDHVAQILCIWCDADAMFLLVVLLLFLVCKTVILYRRGFFTDGTTTLVATPFRVKYIIAPL